MTPTDIQMALDNLERLRRRADDPSFAEIMAVCNHARAVIEDLRKDRERLESELCNAREAIQLVRGLICVGSQTGFDPRSGDWADRLFRSQAVTLKALGADAPKPSDAIDEAMTQRGEG